MTVEEAVRACEFWTTNIAETVALGSSTNPEVARAFNATLSHPMLVGAGPDGPRCYDIRVGRWKTKTDAVTGEIVKDENGQNLLVENPAYTLVAAEIEQRKTNRR